MKGGKWENKKEIRGGQVCETLKYFLTALDPLAILRC